MAHPHIPTSLLTILFDIDNTNLWGLFGAALIVVILFAAAIGLIIEIFYLLTLQNTLKAISPQNQKMRPGQVWLLLIPLFNIVWNFFVVTAIADSIENEYRSRGQSVEPRPTYNLGLAMCILGCCGFIPFLGGFAGIAYLVCFIIYWIKVNEYKNKLLQLPHSNDSQIFGNINSPV